MGLIARIFGEGWLWRQNSEKWYQNQLDALIAEREKIREQRKNYLQRESHMKGKKDPVADEYEAELERLNNQITQIVAEMRSYRYTPRGISAHDTMTPNPAKDSSLSRPYG